MPLALWALAVGAFGIGTTEFVIMGLLPIVGADLGVSLSTAGLLVTGYALGVMVGAPPMTMFTTRLPRKPLLIALMFIFTVGNIACALAPSYGWLMAARVLTSFSHGAFFGIGAVVATRLVPPDKQASAIALMFTGLTLANVMGVPFGTWLGQNWGWRSTFWAVSGIGGVAMLSLMLYLPKITGQAQGGLTHELKALAKPQVILGFLMTVLGFGAVFTTLTYITPLLTDVASFEEASVPLLLVLFGIGLVGGNTLGGKLADKHLMLTLISSFVCLIAVLIVLTMVIHVQTLVVIVMVVFGAAAFMAVSPLQMRVLAKAGGAPNLASAFNIAAFNLGNALGAWLGGVSIDYGLGVDATPLVAACITALGLVVALISWKMDGHEARIHEKR